MQNKTDTNWVIWFTGLSASGKTTLGTLINKELEKKYGNVEMLDGDVTRHFFENDLGYSEEDRMTSLKRIMFGAALVARNGVPTVVACITPTYEMRDLVRRKISKYVEVYCKASVETVMERDPKGHYAKYKQGELHHLIGMDDKYDIPRHPDVICETGIETVEESFSKIQKFLAEKGIL